MCLRGKVCLLCCPVCKVAHVICGGYLCEIQLLVCIAWGQLVNLSVTEVSPPQLKSSFAISWQ